MTALDFRQVDVFSAAPFMGNPVAVVTNADTLSDTQMQTIARWTNLSETTFTLPSRDPHADYRVRIFTASREMPFAGHPTLGTCHAWLEAGGQPKGRDFIQECEIGLVRVRRLSDGLAFAAPPLLVSGALDADLLARVRGGLGLAASEVVDAQWVDNGAGWLVLMLKDRKRVLSLRPDYTQLVGLAIGVIAPFDPERDGRDAHFEVRAFVAGDAMTEDPATGSLNAGIATWLFGNGSVSSSYVVSQGTAIGRAAKISVDRFDGEIWVGGQATTCVKGLLTV